MRARAGSFAVVVVVASVVASAFVVVVVFSGDELLILWLTATLELWYKRGWEQLGMPSKEQMSEDRLKIRAHSNVSRLLSQVALHAQELAALWRRLAEP